MSAHHTFIKASSGQETVGSEKKNQLYYAFPELHIFISSFSTQESWDNAKWPKRLLQSGLITAEVV